MRLLVSLRQSRLLHAYPFVLLLALTLFAFGRVAELRPFDADSILALSWAERSGPLSFARGNELMHPEWRPLPYLSFWIQYQLVGLDNIPSWFAVNVLLWGLCIFVVYLLVYTTVHSQLAAILTAAAVLLDPRSFPELIVITGRQMVLACLFGLTALLLASSSGASPRPRLRRAAIFLLLVMASLSKEPGLAFSAAPILLVLLSRDQDRRALSLVGLGAIGAYFLLRLALAGGALRGYCEDVGFFWVERYVCYADLTWAERFQQYLYNAAAMFVGTLLPGLFGRTGILNANPPLLLPAAFWLLLAVVGWVRMPRQTLPWLGLIAFSALASFAIYRGRNQVFGMMGLYISAGVGLACVLSGAWRKTATRVLVVAAVAGLVWWLGGQARRIESGVQQEVRSMRNRNPCGRLGAQRAHERTVIVELKHRYGMSDPNCAQL
jgi:hypothetical protein